MCLAVERHQDRFVGIDPVPENVLRGSATGVCHPIGDLDAPEFTHPHARAVVPFRHLVVLRSTVQDLLAIRARLRAVLTALAFVVLDVRAVLSLHAYRHFHGRCPRTLESINGSADETSVSAEARESRISKRCAG